MPAQAEGPDRWAGPYAGVHIGYGFASADAGLEVFQPNSDMPYATGPLGYGSSPEGGIAGLQIGINGPSGPFFSGIELDIQGAGIKGTSSTDFAPPNVYTFTYTATTSVDWLATLRARLGIATDSTLFYLTGGLAVGQVSYDATYLITDPRGPGGYANFRSDTAQVGYVVGAGIEHALSPRWSLKLEYQYVNLGDVRTESGLHFVNGTPSDEKVTADFGVELHTLRLGLNFRLP